MVSEPYALYTKNKICRHLVKLFFAYSQKQRHGYAVIQHCRDMKAGQ